MRTGSLDCMHMIVSTWSGMAISVRFSHIMLSSKAFNIILTMFFYQDLAFPFSSALLGLSSKSSVLNTIHPHQIFYEICANLYADNYISVDDALMWTRHPLDFKDLTINTKMTMTQGITVARWDFHTDDGVPAPVVEKKKKVKQVPVLLVAPAAVEAPSKKKKVAKSGVVPEVVVDGRESPSKKEVTKSGKVVEAEVEAPVKKKKEGKKGKKGEVSTPVPTPAVQATPKKTVPTGVLPEPERTGKRVKVNPLYKE